MRKGEATQARILDAATAEFAEHGIAGARVDRIAAAAAANKAQIYTHFGSKAQLFDAVYDRVLRDLVAEVPMTVTDLPGYAVRLYDAWVRNPAGVRIATWARLERTPTGHLLDPAQRKVAYQSPALRAAQRDGDIVAGADVVDLLALVVAMSLAWAPASLVYVAGADDRGHAGRRRALADAVRRVVTP